MKIRLFMLISATMLILGAMAQSQARAEAFDPNSFNERAAYDTEAKAAAVEICTRKDGSCFKDVKQTPNWNERSAYDIIGEADRDLGTPPKKTQEGKALREGDGA